MIAETPAAPWQRTQVDPEIVLAEARRLFPGVTAWAGEYTGSYWVLLDNELLEFKDPHVLITWIRARISPPPHQMTLPTPSPSGVSEHRPRHARPAREPAAPVLFDFPAGRWRRFLGAVRRVLAGERDMAW